MPDEKLADRAKGLGKAAEKMLSEASSIWKSALDADAAVDEALILAIRGLSLEICACVSVLASTAYALASYHGLDASHADIIDALLQHHGLTENPKEN